MNRAKKNQMKKMFAGGIAILLAVLMILSIVAPFLSLL